MSNAANLRSLLASRKMIVAPGAIDCITGRAIAQAGFSAVYMTGAGTSATLGYPDYGLITMTEMVGNAARIVNSIDIPLISDSDTGFGNELNVFRTVQEYERNGLSGLHLEDQVIPKRCGHLDGKQVISVDQMREKIAAAVQARLNPDFLLIARVDSKAVYGFDEAVRRAHAYLDAGADMIFPEALTTPEEFAEFARQVKAPLLANMTEFGKTPYLSVQEFERFGYNLVIFPMSAFRIMMKAVEEALKVLHQEGSQVSILERMTSREDLYRLIHYQDYEQLDSTLATQFSSGLKVGESAERK